MRRVLPVITVLLALTIYAKAGQECTTRKSGSETITTCTGTGNDKSFSQCRSYKSGSVTKTYCR